MRRGTHSVLWEAGKEKLCKGGVVWFSVLHTASWTLQHMKKRHSLQTEPQFFPLPRPSKDLRAICLLDSKHAKLWESAFAEQIVFKEKSVEVSLLMLDRHQFLFWHVVHSSDSLRLRDELPQAVQGPGGVRVQEEHQSDQRHRQSNTEHHACHHRHLRGWVDNEW